MSRNLLHAFPVVWIGTIGLSLATAQGDNSSGEQPSPEQVLSDLVDEMDANNDGLLTETEYDGSLWERLIEFDADNDGRLSTEEYITARVEFVQRSYRRLFDAVDDNDDGHVTRDEVDPESWENWTPRDADKNGSISRDEFLDSAPPPDETRDSPRDWMNSFAQFDQNVDFMVTADEATTRTWNALIEFDANTDESIASVEFRAWDVDRRFHRADADRDGQIIESEPGTLTWNQISDFDGDRNGRISREEFETAWEDKRVRGIARIFGFMDKNSDGLVSKDEMAETAWIRACRFDANSDETLTRDEFEEWREHSG